jgi:hypothetical protein
MDIYAHAAFFDLGELDEDADDITTIMVGSIIKF